MYVSSNVGAIFRIFLFGVKASPCGVTWEPPKEITSLLSHGGSVSEQMPRQLLDKNDLRGTLPGFKEKS